jgi:hypothetical protein
MARKLRIRISHDTVVFTCNGEGWLGKSNLLLKCGGVQRWCRGTALCVSFQPPDEAKPVELTLNQGLRSQRYMAWYIGLRVLMLSLVLL